MSNWSSVKIGITILNFIINFPMLPVCKFYTPLLLNVTLVSFVVGSFLTNFIRSPLKCSISLLIPNIDSSKLISTVCIKLYPYLPHFSVGISMIYIYKSEGAPNFGSSPKFLIFIILPSGSPFGIFISTYYSFFNILYP